jgi:hypothetical protein
MKRIVSLRALLLLLLLLTSTLAGGQQQTAELKDSTAKILSREVRWINPQSADLFSTLTMNLAASQLPGGILAVRKCGAPQPTFVPAETSTLQSELNRMAKVMPDYQWTLDDGVVNFLPKNYAPSPLDILIADFDAENVTTIKAYNQLFDTLAVKNGFSRLGLHEPAVQLVFGGGSETKDQRHITVKLKNVTLRQALNRIVKTDGRKVWILSIDSCGEDNTYQRSLMN